MEPDGTSHISQNPERVWVPAGSPTLPTCGERGGLIASTRARRIDFSCERAQERAGEISNNLRVAIETVPFRGVRALRGF